jgi:hypothetical protein
MWNIRIFQQLLKLIMVKYYRDPRAKKLLNAWMEIHNDELQANWQLAVNGEHTFKIRPLE